MLRVSYQLYVYTIRLARGLNSRTALTNLPSRFASPCPPLSAIHGSPALARCPPQTPKATLGQLPIRRTSELEKASRIGMSVSFPVEPLLKYFLTFRSASVLSRAVPTSVTFLVRSPLKWFLTLRSASVLPRAVPTKDIGPRIHKPNFARVMPTLSDVGRRQ